MKILVDMDTGHGHMDYMDTGQQSMKWTGSVRLIENPIQYKWIWTGLDCKITHLTDSGLDWIGNLPFPYFVLEDKLLFS